MMRIAYETAICCNPHNSSDWDSLITRQLAYNHSFCQNVSTKKIAGLYWNELII